MKQKSKLGMNLAGGKVIPVVKKSLIEMHPVGRNNPCGTKELDGDASGRPK